MEQQEPQPSDALQLTEDELFAKYAVKPEEAQAWLTHLGYTSKDMWELMNQEAALAIPIFSHHLRMVAYVACCDEPIMFESLDSNRYAYGGGHWDVEEVREDATAIKQWFSEHNRAAEETEQDSSEEITRDQVLDILSKVDEYCSSPYYLQWYESELDEEGIEQGLEFGWVEGGEEAKNIVDAWEQQELKKADGIGTKAAILEYFYDKATIWFDAGFNYSGYLEEVLWEVEEVARIAQEQSLTDLTQRSLQKIDEIKLALAEEQD